MVLIHGIVRKRCMVKPLKYYQV